MKMEGNTGVKIIHANLCNIIGREIIQNSTNSYVVFGSVATLEAFAEICESMLILILKKLTIKAHIL